MDKAGLEQQPLIIGHRGASADAPENTLESFRLAREQGADGIEADFRLTADGRIVCMHDGSTLRTTGVDLEVSRTSLDELRRLDAGLWKGAAWSGAGIATLEEVLAAVPGDSWFFIELKSGPEIVAPLKQLLERSGHSPEKIRLLAFSASLITELGRQLPDWHACWLCDYHLFRATGLWSPTKTELLETLHRTGARGLASANRMYLDRELTDTLKGLGREIHVWTVDRLSDARRLSALGVDSIMTNRPGWLREKLHRAGIRHE